MKQPTSPAKRNRKAPTPKPSKADVVPAGRAVPMVSRDSGQIAAASIADDGALLDRARMQWQFGDWENLAALGWEALEAHPQRAILALLVGAAHQQVDDHVNARRFVSAACEWGCDVHTVARVLVAGAHNTLGRIAAVRQQEAAALKHFKAAVDGISGDERLACQARSVSEIARLNLVDQAVRMIKMQERPQYDAAPVIGFVGEQDRSNSSRMTQLRDRLLDMPGDQQHQTETENSRRVATLASASRGAIVIAGMRHSGSTALFNIVRLALKQRGADFVSFYSEGIQSERLHDPSCPLLLIKTHEFRDDVASRASMVITTRRDLRDTVASAKRRKFPTYERLGGAVEYAKYNRTLHDIWHRHSDYEFVYETYMAEPLAEMTKLFRFIGLDGLDVAAVHAEVSTLPVDQYRESLLSPVHITDPEHLLSFKDSLVESEIARINRDHTAWLQRYGYEQGGHG